MKVEDFEILVEKWARLQGISEYSTIQDRMLKTMSEIGSLAKAVVDNDGEAFLEAVGNTLIDLAIVCSMFGVSMAKGWAHAGDTLIEQAWATVNEDGTEPDRSFTKEESAMVETQIQSHPGSDMEFDIQTYIPDRTGDLDNRGPTGVLITHIPSGRVESCHKYAKARLNQQIAMTRMRLQLALGERQSKPVTEESETTLDRPDPVLEEDQSSQRIDP